MLQTLVVLADRIMLGHYSTDALTAMQINGAVLWSVTSTMTAFSVGAVALVGRQMGSGDRARAAAATRAALLLALGVGAVVALAGLGGLEGILALFPAAGAEVQAAARAYLSLVFVALPLRLVAFAAAAVLQAAGNTRTPFLVAIAANGLNVAVNYSLIFGHWGAPELGIRGAAWGSVAAMAVNASVLLALPARPSGRPTLRGSGGEGEALRRMLRVAAPTFGERLVQHAGFLGFFGLIGALGGTAMAANQALDSIESISYLSADGMGVAAAAIVSQRLGAERPQEAAAGARIAVLGAVGLLSAYACAFVLFPAALLGLFSNDPAIVRTGIPCFYVAAAAQPFMAASIVLGQALRGAGDTRTAFYVSLGGWLMVRLSATYLFAFGLDWGLVGVWIGSSFDWGVRCLALSVAFFRGGWRQVAV